MNRRDIIRSGAGVAALGLSGCLDVLDSMGGSGGGIPAYPTELESKPGRPYHPTYLTGAEHIKTVEKDGYGFELAYTHSTRSWITEAAHAERREVLSVQFDPEDVYLFLRIWDLETGAVLPDAHARLSVREKGSSDALPGPSKLPKLSPRLGLHYGTAERLSDGTTYTAYLGVSCEDERCLDNVSLILNDLTLATVEFTFDSATRAGIPFDSTLDRAGSEILPDLLEPWDAPRAVVPSPDELPGKQCGTAESGSLHVTVQLHDDATQFGGDADQVYVSLHPHTPSHHLFIPDLSLRCRFSDGESSGDWMEAAHSRTERLGYHQGCFVDDTVSEGTVEMEFRYIPDCGFTEGYETAFSDLGPTSVSLSTAESQ